MLIPMIILRKIMTTKEWEVDQILSPKPAFIGCKIKLLWMTALLI